MRNVALLIMLCLCAMGCQSTSRTIIQTDPLIGDMRAANDHLVEVEFDGDLISGEATGYQALWFFEWGFSDTSEGLTVATGSNRAEKGVDGFFGQLAGGLAFIGSLFDTSLPSSKISSAAVRQACDEAGCDVLGFPMYTIDQTDYWIFKLAKVSVKGFPGHVRGITNVTAPKPSEIERIAEEAETVHLHVGSR